MACARFSIGESSVIPAASASPLLRTSSCPRLVKKLTTTTAFWPRVLARMTVCPVAMAKSALPANAALIAPTPVMTGIFTSSPVCFQ